MKRRTARFALVAVTALLACGAITGRAAGESSLTVEYRSPRLTIHADDVPLAEVLVRVGRVVGFEVVGHAPDARVSVTLEGVSVEEALRRLLRGENHSLVYRASDAADPFAGLDRLVLLGSSRRSPAEGEEPGQRPSRDASMDGHRSDQIASTPVMPAAPVEASPVSTASSVPASSWAGEAPAEMAADPESSGVAGLLRTHAIAAQPPVRSGAPQAPAAAHADLSAALAETTRRAYQGVTSLVEALATATRALEESQAAASK